MSSEFALIERYFKRPARRATVGVGDDCALVGLSAGHELAISTDMLVAGTHFLPDVNPRTLGHKVLAVNLSDLAAMGAVPRYATLAAALPEADEAWIAEFAAGFFALADAHDVELIGGDTTRGPMNFCVTIFGETPIGRAVRRDGTCAGDDIWVSGTLGGAALGLAWLRGAAAWLTPAQGRAAQALLETPTPRVPLGVALRGLASAMLDLSDGIGGDLAHIANASGLTARLEVDTLPVFAALKSRPPNERRRFALAGGDDYELCFTAPKPKRDAVLAAGHAQGLSVARVGEMLPRRSPSVAVLQVDSYGEAIPEPFSGYQHF